MVGETFCSLLNEACVKIPKVLTTEIDEDFDWAALDRSTICHTPGSSARLIAALSTAKGGRSRRRRGLASRRRRCCAVLA